MSAKILLLDIETAPKKAFVWSMWNNNVGLNQLLSDTYVLCWNAKWLNDKWIYGDSLPNHSLYKHDMEDDSLAIGGMWEMLDEADVVIAHNAKRFDIPVLNARFVTHGYEPPSPYKIVDTLEIARRQFKFTSNRLDALGMFLGLGRKMDTGGFDLWRRVLEGDKQAWKDMTNYCAQDVHLLEEVYLKLRAWHKQHPNVALYGDLERPKCNVCGSSHVVKKGYDYTGVSIFHRYKCVDCGANLRERHAITDKDKRKNILTTSK